VGNLSASADALRIDGRPKLTVDVFIDDYGQQQLAGCGAAFHVYMRPRGFSKRMDAIDLHLREPSPTSRKAAAYERGKAPGCGFGRKRVA
jgi:hypothetical protein